jgi:hypothetical protein
MLNAAKLLPHPLPSGGFGERHFLFKFVLVFDLTNA